ncbi:hypothetical protein CHUAL_008760 [Chamberlinius hualienensis]
MSRPPSPMSPGSAEGTVNSSPGPILDVEQDDDSSRECCNTDDSEYFKPLKRLRMVHISRNNQSPPNQPYSLGNPSIPNVSQQQLLLPPNNPHPIQKPLTPFSIKDILNHRPKRTLSEPARIVRPWDLGNEGDRGRPRSADDDSRSESDCPESPNSAVHQGAANSSPLDALFEMTSKAFDGVNGGENSSDSSRDHLHIFSNRQQPKKKRKSRTAFTNHQIFELEKRFLYQKYLSPADRDEIALSLGLTNAQVITWFQNRRAKLKRDMEELKKDVESSSQVIGVQLHIMDTIQDLSMMKGDVDSKCTVVK